MPPDRLLPPRTGHAAGGARRLHQRRRTILQFNTENYDFGKVISGETINYTYLMTNAGDAVLEITNVKPSCGCATVGAGWAADPGRARLPPTNPASSPFRSIPSGRGAIDKTVAVTSNDRSRPTVILHIRGIARRRFELSQQTVSFMLKPDAASNTTTVIRIFNRTEEPLTLSARKAPPTSFPPCSRPTCPAGNLNWPSWPRPPRDCPPPWERPSSKGPFP